MTDYRPPSDFSTADLRGLATSIRYSGYPEPAKALITAAKSAETESAEREILIAAYNIIHPPPPPPPPAEKPKKERKPRKKVEKPKPPEKTAEELVAEAREAQQRLLSAMTDAMEQYRSKMEHLKVEAPDGKIKYGKNYSDIFPALVGDTKLSKEWRGIMTSMKDMLFAEWVEKQTKTSGRKRKSDSEKLDALRDYTGDEGKNERTVTGETMTINDFAGGTGETVCKVISYFNHTDKHGVELPENQKCLYNFSSKTSGTAQVQPKPALRKEPIDQITACKCRVKPNFFKNVYERETDGSWSKISVDWGWAPCNIKLAEGQDYCSRHMASLASSDGSGRSKVVDWEREMLLVPDAQIV